MRRSRQRQESAVGMSPTEVVWQMELCQPLHLSARAKMAASQNFALELVRHQHRQLPHMKFIIRVSHHVVAMLPGTALVGSVGAETHKPWGNRQSLAAMYEKAKHLVFESHESTTTTTTTSQRSNEAIPGPANTTVRLLDGAVQL